MTQAGVRRGTVRAHVPGPWRPEEPRRPGEPLRPAEPGWPGTPLPPARPLAPPGQSPSFSPARPWLDPHAGWKATLYERLLAQRIVLASGPLDSDAAGRLSAQLLTLDAEGDQPIRLELQNLRAELPAALTVMGILDVLHVPVHGCTVTAVTAREQQMTRMLDTLYFRLAEVTGREVGEIREDARRGRSLTTAQAIGYGLIQAQEASPRSGSGHDPGSALE